MATQLDRSTRVMNSLVKGMSRMGIRAFGAKELVVIGRKSGQPHSTPVNPVEVEGQLYLVAPRGQTQWVRNARHNPRVTVRSGRREAACTVHEVHGSDAVPVMRHYLKRWAWEVGKFFPEGVTATSTDAELEAIVAAHPVFRLERA
ncbi:nitroreductase family deazaflavin-dependent oxidoreductase [Flexivirga oryzae]|uniref:Deazaflavin-dependent oxidoreductase (Nitroreductase family) n=1 Tax=Flexivirga oryzae TaxID=1794944 RepID=A0A839N8D6_9MICO|nr:nitroreductase family deazaflavin-dependent oxidoreductase [Flexivirga oryzae]MBB2893049.1 deazaflavin-dependent oxidoreductase (nitroreductase family) [Flexivirga oryzae]